MSCFVRPYCTLNHSWMELSRLSAILQEKGHRIRLGHEFWRQATAVEQLAGAGGHGALLMETSSQYAASCFLIALLKNAALFSRLLVDFEDLRGEGADVVVLLAGNEMRLEECLGLLTLKQALFGGIRLLILYQMFEKMLHPEALFQERE